MFRAYLKEGPHDGAVIDVGVSGLDHRPLSIEIPVITPTGIGSIRYTRSIEREDVYEYTPPKGELH